MSPVYLRKRFTRLGLAHPTCADRQGKLRIPSAKEFQLMGSRRRVFPTMAPSPWNILLLEVRLIPSLLIFSKEP